jgi:hypothetical protein
VAFVAICLVAGCGDDGSDDGVVGPGAECPVAPDAVAEALGVPVAVGAGASPTRCTYSVAVEPPDDDEDGPGRVGGRVVVDVRALAGGDYASALETVERRGGPTEALKEGDVDDAERGWVSTVGRAVSVGAADELRLATVVVVDAGLDAAGAREAALQIAGEALG